MYYSLKDKLEPIQEQANLTNSLSARINVKPGKLG